MWPAYINMDHTTPKKKKRKRIDRLYPTGHGIIYRVESKGKIIGEFTTIEQAKEARMKTGDVTARIKTINPA